MTYDIDDLRDIWADRLDEIRDDWRDELNDRWKDFRSQLWKLYRDSYESEEEALSAMEAAFEEHDSAEWDSRLESEFEDWAQDYDCVTSSLLCIE